MNKIFTTLFFVAFASNLFAQGTDTRKAADDMDNKLHQSGELKEGWTSGGVLSINMNHTKNDNWQGASEAYALSINGSLNYFAYRKWEKNLWKNDVLLAYGVLNSPSTNEKFRKHDDRAILTSMFGHQIKKNLYYAAALDINTQMAPGYDYKIVDTNSKSGYAKTSNLFTPGLVRLGVGLLWQPRKNLSVYLSPATANVYTKLDKDFRDIKYNSVDSGKTLQFGLGALLRADYYTTINKNLTYKTRFVAFTDYLDRPFNKIDWDWMNSVIFTATKYINVKLDVNFRYYEGQYHKVQWLEMLGVGFAYKF